MRNWINKVAEMHRIAYKLIRKPSSKKKLLHNEVSRSVSPAVSDLDREEITKLKVENERLKSCLESRESEIGCLKDDIENLRDGFDSPEANRDNDNSTDPHDDDTIDGSHEKHPHEEFQIAREALTSLRRCFTENDPHQHTIDTVEQTLSSLVERLDRVQSDIDRHNNHSLDPRHSLSMDSCSEHHGSHVSSSLCFPMSSVDMSLQGSYVSRPSTKLVYYTSKSTTPFVSIIPKRLGEITLRDLKIALDRPGQFKYHFKTLDRDYGMVKEEIVHDEAIIPGWDEKIVAWIVEDDD